MTDDKSTPDLISYQDAVKIGKIRYFTGIPCKRGHIAERAVSGRCCVTCRDDRARLWNKNNLEERRAIRQRWRDENREYHRAIQRAYYEKNKGEILDRGKLYYRQNKERHSNVVRKWKSEHPIEQRVYAQNRRARKLGIVGRGLTADDYRAMISQQNGICAYCNQKSETLLIDHVVAINRMGQHDAENVVLACQRCNSLKTNQTVASFLELLRIRHPECIIATPECIARLIQSR